MFLSKITTAHPALTSLYLLTECSEGSPDLEALKLLHQCQPRLQDRKLRRTSLNYCEYSQTYKMVWSGTEEPPGSLMANTSYSVKIAVYAGLDGNLPLPVTKIFSSTPGLACNVILHR